MSVNKVILMGYTGKDPDVKTFDNGGVVAQFPLATTKRGFKTKDGKEIPERTEWHNIVLSNGLAKIASQYVKKGDKLYKIFGYDMEMLTPKKDGQSVERQGAVPMPPTPNPDDLPF